ncbi:MAG: bifunctional diaminohydroxyphosphoribosylaminopyrimidine deaminase/5-amino-6-(5-phosphoribosylamino)uracil reductase RibD [Flavobacteriaceae bacterium]|nr:bifunctional diaminohydroxyphosphoribosylaminopyrimidine deaminase/5-amino-6-(5-phosphoribosylamino)uracil reductase RibD [Flavobacteriaceae bacterium]
MKIKEKYIRRCIEIAQNGLGTTYPNPLVGAVIVYNHQIIGEGWHRKAGEPHAEVLAINAVKKPELLSKSTLYVSLEPCSHFGKTPPCADLIIEKGIRKVVIGSVDPNKKVAGRGIKKLLEAGCEVHVGVLESACSQLNKRFFAFHLNKRPYIILKWAESTDGYIAPMHRNEPRPVWITSAQSRQLVHKWRTEEQAILVGTQTVLADNPKLNARTWTGNAPVRVVIDRNLRVPKSMSVWDQSQKTIFIVDQNLDLENPNSHIIFETIDFSGNVPHQIANILYSHGLQSVIVEGGAKTLQSFIDAELWDEARIFTGNTCLQDGISTPKFTGKLVREENIHTDILRIYEHGY